MLNIRCIRNKKTNFGNRQIIMRTTRLFIAIPALAIALTVAAVSPYPQLEAKAERFFSHGEWASAAAIFDLMLEERPDVPSTYGQAIVSNAMRADTTAQMRLMHQALDNHIPFDSVFSQVKQWSFSLGKSHLYENFLKESRTAYPWMRRTIDSNLLRYYTFRHNGAEMITYSLTMLDGAPDNRDFLHTLAQGYMLTGDQQNGIDTYLRIIDLYPDDFNALVTLGNWYASTPGKANEAYSCLRRAYNIHPTPYIDNLIKKLNSPKKH